MRKVAVLASGNGSNAENLYHFFAQRGSASLAVILSNHSDAGVMARAHRLKIPAYSFTTQEMLEGSNCPLERIRDRPDRAGRLYVLYNRTLLGILPRQDRQYPSCIIAQVRWKRNVRTSRTRSRPCCKGKRKRYHHSSCRWTL